jgi:hypothetical protein
MNESLLAYTQGSGQDSTLRHTLIEDLKRATTEFLELREQSFCGVAGTELE